MKRHCAYWFTAFHKDSGDKTLSMTILADSEEIARKELKECGYFGVEYLGTALIYEVESSIQFSELCNNTARFLKTL